jgi:hypothetical protein
MDYHWYSHVFKFTHHARQIQATASTIVVIVFNAAILFLQRLEKSTKVARGRTVA